MAPALTGRSQAGGLHRGRSVCSKLYGFRMRHGAHPRARRTSTCAASHPNDDLIFATTLHRPEWQLNTSKAAMAELRARQARDAELLSLDALERHSCATLECVVWNRMLLYFGCCAPCCAQPGPTDTVSIEGSTLAMASSLIDVIAQQGAGPEGQWAKQEGGGGAVPQASAPQHWQLLQRPPAAGGVCATEALQDCPTFSTQCGRSHLC